MAADVSILISAQDRTRAAFESVRAGLDNINNRASALMGGFGKLTGVAVGLSAGMALLQNVKVIAVLDQLDELQEKTGISVSKLGELRYASEVAGTPFESLVGGVGRLSKKMAEAASGNQAAAASFDALGVKVKNADGTLRSQDDVLGDMAERFSQWEDGAAKAAWAQEFFGKSGADLIPILNLGREGLAEMRKEGQALGVTYDGDLAKAAAQFNDNMKKLQLASEAASITMAGPLVQALADVSDRLVQARINGDLFGAVLQTYQGLMKFDMLGAPAQIGNAIGNYLRGPQAAGGRGFVNPALPASAPTPKKDAPNLPGTGGKGAGAAPADDPTKKLLDNQLKDWERAIAQQGDLLGQRNRMIELYNGQSMFSIKDYYAAQRAALDEATDTQAKAYDDQIAALRAYQASAKKETDKADAQGKIDALADKRDKLQRDRGIAAIEMDFKEANGKRDVAAAVQDINGQLAELQGRLGDAASIKFDAQFERVGKMFSAEGNTAAAESLRMLRENSVAQAELNGLSAKFALLQGDLSMAEERITIARDRGTMGELESLRASGEARRAKVVLLQQELDKFVQLSQLAALTPEQLQSFQRLQLQLEQISATMNPLADKFDTTLGNGFGTLLTDITSRAKTAEQAFKDFGATAFQEMNSLIMKDLGKSLYKSLFGDIAGGGSPGNFLADLFGGAAKSGGTAGGSSGGGIASMLSTAGNWFAGFFAEGGDIPAGQFGIAGERGMELIEGPATVTPLHKLGLGAAGGGNTIHQTIVFQSTGPVDRRTQQQVAAQAASGAQRAISRNY